MLSSLSTELEMTLQNARTALQFWCKRGVLYLKNESKDLGAEVYSVQKEQPDKKHNGKSIRIYSKVPKLDLINIYFIIISLRFAWIEFISP